jgi:hypothetical protein
MKRRTTNNDTIAPVHLKYIYESEPDLRLGVSIGAFTAAIVASHPDNPIDHLESFLTDLTVFHSKLLPAQVEKIFLLILVRFFGSSWIAWRSMFEKPPRVRLPRASQRFPGTQGP